MTNLLTLITAIGIMALTTDQLIDIATEAEKEATEAMQKHNAQTQAINDFIKHRGYKHADTDNH